MADLFRITVEGAGPSARSFDQAQRRLQDEIIAEFRRLGHDVEQAYRDHAPEDRGLTAESVHAAVYFGVASEPRITVRAGVRDPNSGYAYLAVTRFGHRKTVIRPKSKTNAKGRPAMLAVHYMGHRNPHIVAFVPEVRGSRQATDWTEEAAYEADVYVERAIDRLGRAVESRVM